MDYKDGYWQESRISSCLDIGQGFYPWLVVLILVRSAGTKPYSVIIAYPSGLNMVLTNLSTRDFPLSPERK